MNTCTFRNVKKIVKIYIFFKNLHIKKTLFNNLINSDKSIFYFLKINDISRYFLFLHNSVVHCIKLYMYIMNLSRGLMINVICIATHCIVCLVIQRRSATVSTSGRNWGTSCRLLWRMLRLRDPRIPLTSWPTDCTPPG